MTKRKGVGFSFYDGWNFGVGFGLAMAIAVPIILAILTCIGWVIILAVGGSIFSVMGAS